jgi:hypothetical protein
MAGGRIFETGAELVTLVWNLKLYTAIDIGKVKNLC